jgi:transcriptional regulator of aromatic amino acid metabolism
MKSLKRIHKTCLYEEFEENTLDMLYEEFEENTLDMLYEEFEENK